MLSHSHTGDDKQINERAASVRVQLLPDPTDTCRHIHSPRGAAPPADASFTCW